jgi:hypothetical protein
MLLEVDVRKASDMLYPLVEKPVPGVSIREQLTQFAEREGLML